MALDGLEAVVLTNSGRSRAECLKSKVHVIRYADDFVVTSASKDVLVSQVLPAIRQFMAVRGLELAEEKTRISHVTEGFDFLGQNVRRYGGKLLIKPAKKSIKSLLDKIREIIKGNTSSTQELLIRQLNPVIRGWAMYHRHIVAKAVFTMVDHNIWKLLWSWAMRRHPNKGARWVKDRYFPTNGSRKWSFATKGSTKGTTLGVELFRASTVSIIRHVKIRAATNPFTPEGAEYLTQRRNSRRPVGLPGASVWCWRMA
jgi:RNA-directed DNA polymerase